MARRAKPRPAKPRPPMRRGSTVTFSVSVDRATKKLLRDIADRSFDGNVSELITQVARQAARQQAALDLLAAHGMKPMTEAEADAFEASIAAELVRARRKRRRRAA